MCSQAPAKVTACRPRWAIGFADIEKRLDVKERVETLANKMITVETALNVRL
jgi:hypothetical protein